MTTYVIDASVAVKWFVDEDGTPEAEAVLARDGVFVAPELIRVELASVAWKKRRRGEITAEQAAAIVEHGPRAFSDLRGLEALAERAYAIATALDHSVYDCFYLALAEREAAPLVTDDDRLLKRVEGTPWAARVEALRPRAA